MANNQSTGQGGSKMHAGQQSKGRSQRASVHQSKGPAQGGAVEQSKATSKRLERRLKWWSDNKATAGLRTLDTASAGSVTIQSALEQNQLLPTGKKRKFNAFPTDENDSLKSTGKKRKKKPKLSDEDCHAKSEFKFSDTAVFSTEHISIVDNVELKQKKKRQTSVEAAAATSDANIKTEIDKLSKELDCSSSKKPEEKNTKHMANQKNAKPTANEKPKAKNEKGYVIFVGNLSYDTTQEDIEKHFQSTGGLKAVRLLTNKDTGKSRGCGYVEFHDSFSHKLGLRLHESMLGGRKINVEFTSRGRKTDKRVQRLKEKNARAARFKRLRQTPE